VDNYNKKISKIQTLTHLLHTKQGYLLAFRIWGNGTEIFDTFLPPPNIHKGLNENSYLIAWLIEGFFLTAKNQKFLRDVINRFILTLEKDTLRVEWINWINLARIENKNILSLTSWNLRDDIAPYLESLKENKRDYKSLELLASYTEYKESDDIFFDWLRFKIYDFVKEHGKDTLTLDYCKELAIIGYEIMGHKKGISTPLAKAKSIYKWVVENYNPNGVNNWNYKRKLTNEEYQKKRKERALKNNQIKYLQTHKKIINLITGDSKEKYKKKNGKWHLSKIAKDLELSRNIIKKHLQAENIF